MSEESIEQEIKKLLGLIDGICLKVELAQRHTPSQEVARTSAGEQRKRGK